MVPLPGPASAPTQPPQEPTPLAIADQHDQRTPSPEALPLPDQDRPDTPDDPPLHLKVKEEPPDSPIAGSNKISCPLEQIRESWQKLIKVKQEKNINHAEGRELGCIFLDGALSKTDIDFAFLKLWCTSSLLVLFFGKTFGGKVR